MLFYIIYSAALARQPDKKPLTFYKDSAIILNYHDIEDGVNGPATISRQLFKNHMRYLKDNGYNVISVDRLFRYMAGNHRCLLMPYVLPLMMVTKPSSLTHILLSKNFRIQLHASS
jgi:hypothetical protein